MKYLLILFVLLAVTACSDSKSQKEAFNAVHEKCLGGVTYYVYREKVGGLGFGYMSPKLKHDGSASSCENQSTINLKG